MSEVDEVLESQKGMAVDTSIATPEKIEKTTKKRKSKEIKEITKEIKEKKAKTKKMKRPSTKWMEYVRLYNGASKAGIWHIPKKGSKGYTKLRKDYDAWLVGQKVV